MKNPRQRLRNRSTTNPFFGKRSRACALFIATELRGREYRSTRRPLTSIVDEDAEVIALLSDLVSGQAPFDITESDEYVEGYRVGLDPRLVSQLRRGEFAVQAHFDMHGMIQGAAKEALKEFIIASVRKGLRTVLVVHGRGLSITRRAFGA